MQSLKKTLLLILILFPLLLLGQDKTKIKKDDNLYITIDSKTPFFITGDQNSDSTTPLKDSQIFNVKKNYIDIYLKWVNPIRYTIKISDSTYADPRDTAVSDFVSQLLTQFDISKSEFLKGETLQVTDTLQKSAIDTSSDSNSNCLEELSFSRLDLWKLKVIAKDELCKENSALTAVFFFLKEIEKRNIVETGTELEKMIDTIFSNNDISKVEEINRKSIKLSNEIANSYRVDFSYLVQLKILLEKLNQTDAFIKKNIEEWLEKEEKNLERNKSNALKLAEYVAQIKKSTEFQSTKVKGFYRVKNVAIPEGKEVLTKIQIIENKLNKETMSIEKETEKIKKITMNRYDFIAPSVGTGMFFASTSLRSFGVATNDKGELIVSEDTITENTAVTGLLLNFNFDISSRYLSPLLQIGIDPTKKHPFLLLGGGFSIPSSNFSISGGPIWTWEASLNKYGVNDVVESTTALEEDTSHSFNVKPKGYYIGLSYSF